MKKLISILLFFIALQAFSQNPVSTRQLRLTTIPAANASDTAAIVANRGRIWYDFTTNRFRVNRGGVNGFLGSGSGGGGGGLSTASNGLTATGSNVALGGALTANSIISGAFDLSFTNSRIGIGTSSLLAGRRLQVTGNSIFNGELEISASVNAEPALAYTGTVSDATGVGNAHFVQDLSTVTRTGNIGNASYDSRLTYSGVANTFDHHSSYQSAPTYDNVSITNHYGLYDRPTISGTGNITNRYGVHVLPHIGTGTVTNNYGVYVGTFIGSNTYSFYGLGGPAYFSKFTSASETLLTLARTGAANGSEQRIEFLANTNGTAMTAGTISALTNTPTSSDLLFYTNRTGGSSTELAARINGDGNFRVTRGTMSVTDGTNALPAYAFASDLTMGMFRNVDRLAFSTGGINRFQLDASGNAVIGNIAPTARLTVFHPTAATESATQYINGTTGTGTTNGLFVGIDTDAHSRVWYKNGADIKFGTNNIERGRITGAGLFSWGGRGTFTSTATLPGFNPGSFAGDPSTLVNADLWYNTVTQSFRGRANATTGSFMLNTSPLANAIPFYSNTTTLSTNSGLTFNGTTFTTPNVVSNGNITLTGLISSTQPTNGGGNFVATTNFVGGADPSLTMSQIAVNTTNATPTNLVSNAVPLLEATIMMKGLLHAYRTGGSGGTNGDCAFYEIQYLFNTVAGTTNVVNGSVTVIGESNAAWNCTVSVLGGTVIEINVTGAANNNITWQMVKLETSIIQ